MKKMLLAAVALLPLAGCADPYYGGPTGAGPIGYNGYYDDYYGPIYDGYWGDGGVFYYRSHERGRFVADRGGHFRHDMGQSPEGLGGPGPGRDHGPGQGPGVGRAFHEFHGSMTPPAGRGGGRHH